MERCDPEKRGEHWHEHGANRDGGPGQLRMEKFRAGFLRQQHRGPSFFQILGGVLSVVCLYLQLLVDAKKITSKDVFQCII